MSSFILKGHICYSINPNKIEVFEDSYLICIDGYSKGVYRSIPSEYQELEVFDYTDKLIIPGMIDLHIHAPQFSFRGMSMDLELMDWLNNYTFPEEQKYNDLVYADKAYTIFVNELVKSATTRACIFATKHRNATVHLMDLMEKSGLVSYVGKVNMDREAPDELVETSAEDSAFNTFGWVNETRNKYRNTYPILTPRFIPSCSDTLMEELKEIQMTYNLPVQSHLSESLGEIDFVQSLRPNNRFYGESYNHFDLFGVNKETNQSFKTVMAHCVWSTEEEVKLMKDNGVYIAHCPASNLNLSSGIAPIRIYLEKGLNIGLGTDIAAGHSISMFRAVTDTVQVSKMYFRLINQNYKPIVFSEAFYLATKGGGSFFGNVGSFEKNYEFDALVLDDSIFLHPQPLTIIQRLERAFYLNLDEKGLISKFVFGNKIL